MSGRVRAIATMFRVNFAEIVQYRMSALAGLSIGVFWVLVEITMYRVFFLYAQNATGGAIAGLTLAQTISYSWLSQTFFGIQASGIPGDILGKITGGDVGVELCRPLPLYDLWLARTMSASLMPIVWRGSLTLLVGALLNAFGIGLRAPASPGALALFLVGMFGGFCLSTSYKMLLTALRMNLTWGDGPIHMMGLLGLVLSGNYLPLQLWPDFLQRFLLFQPFAGSLDVPIRLYVGSMPISAAAPALIAQWAWVVVFACAGRALMARRIRGVIVQGG